MRQRMVSVSSTVMGLLLAGCAGSGPAPAGPAPPTSPSPTAAPSPSSTTPKRTEPTGSGDSSSATEMLVLRRQIDIQVGGDGLYLTCKSDVAGWREPEAPAVWMNNLFSLTEYPGNVVLCLKGFEVGSSITLSVTTGSSARTVTVTPRSGPPEADQNFPYEALPSETLFDSRNFAVYTQVYDGRPVDDSTEGLLVSDMWTFVPPTTVRDELASSGGFTITARQGSTETSTKQAIQTPTSVTYQLLERTGTSAARRFVVYGFPAHVQVPIGLYRRRQRESEQATLVDTLALVKMPSSRVAEVGLESALHKRDPGSYCLAPPVEGDVNCEDVEIWTEYPGEVAQGDRGEAVRQWQEILIQAGIIADRVSNRDGYFGPATVKAFKSYLENRGIPSPDGSGQLGRNTYNLITK